MSISDASSMILKISLIAQDGETFILKMPSVKIEELAKSMVDVFKKRTSQKTIPKIKISKVREYERFYEILVTSDEIPFCYDLGDMYKLSKKQSKSILSDTQFNSETGKKISKIKLEKIINELMDEYL
jgi:FlaA1/EpsC-like NDP-sugar epimerase